LKPSNCLVKGSMEDPCLKLTDFGLAYYLQSVSMSQTLTNQKDFCGTYLYASPESFDPTKKSKTKENDIYCFSMTSIQILYPERDNPYGDMMSDMNLPKICMVKMQGRKPEMKLPSGYPPGFFEELKKTISSCIETEPIDRPNMEQLRQNFLEIEADLDSKESCEGLPKKMAICVVGSRYGQNGGWGDLTGAEVDGDNMAAFLEGRGYKVILLKNCQNIAEALDQIVEQLTDLEIKNLERFVFYFAGHGLHKDSLKIKPNKFSPEELVKDSSDFLGDGLINSLGEPESKEGLICDLVNPLADKNQYCDFVILGDHCRDYRSRGHGQSYEVKVKDGNFKQYYKLDKDKECRVIRLNAVQENEFAPDGVRSFTKYLLKACQVKYTPSSPSQAWVQCYLYQWPGQGGQAA